MRLLVCAAVALSTGCAWAQEQAASDVVTPVPLTRGLPVTRGPQAAKPMAPKFQQHNLWVQKDTPAHELLSQRGVAVDDKTLASLRQLNPQIRADGTVPAGSKLSYFTALSPARTDAASVAPKATIDMAQVARASVQPQVEYARDSKQKTAALKATSYERNADFVRHRALVSDLDKTARLVEQRAGSMSARDLALSQYYLDEANARARSLLVRAPAAIPAEGIAQLQGSVAPLQGMQQRLMSGKSPFGYRNVVVTVKGRANQPIPPRLRVYVLPGGVLDRPEAFGVDTIRQWLVDLTFQDLTSPSRWTVAQGEMRVWVGPDSAYDAMARRIFDRGTIAYTPLHIAPDAAPEQELQFTAPGDVVKP